MVNDMFDGNINVDKGPSMALSSSIFISELMKMSSNIIWKNTALANSLEDPFYSITVDEFIAAHKGLLNFDTIFRFTIEDLESAGLSGDLAELCIDTKVAIPLELRPLAADAHIAHLLEKNSLTGHYINYVEHNNYYRMLMGLPDLEDTFLIYNTKYNDIPKDVPIHELNIAQRFLLENRGYIKDLIQKYPEKKYLMYVGVRQVDFYAAREAERFSILFSNPSEYPNMEADFKDCYRDCTSQIVRIYYSDAFRKTNSIFDGFIAMCILFMTVQLMNYKYLDADITRDFYDLESIRYIYQSYGVPFYSSIPLNYHKSIIKSINRLISYKGSTRVFYELFDLFGFGILDVYEYYLIKTHRMDPHGNPLFVKKADGSLDKRAMYDILFGKVRLYDDPPLELSNPMNHLEYSAMTVVDPYWVSDASLLDKLYDEEFNYLETKYIGIQTLFNMMQIMYESCYFFRMIQDNKDLLTTTKLYITTIDRYVGIFDIIIYACALICKKNHFLGNLSTNLPSTAKVIGYNFREGLTKLKQYVIDSPCLRADPYIDELIKNMDVSSLSSVNTTLKKILDLHEYLNNRMSDAKDRTEWQCYCEIQNLLLYSEMNEQVYKKADGTTAESFQDLLADLNPEIYGRFINPEVDISLELDTVLVLLHKSVTNLTYIESAAGMEISVMIAHLFKIMEFFKSAKSELTGYTIVYTLSTRGMNIMKFFSEIELYSHEGWFSDKLGNYRDLIQFYHFLETFKVEELTLEDRITSQCVGAPWEDYVEYLRAEIAEYQEKVMLAFDKVHMDDVISALTTETVMGSWLNLRDPSGLMPIYTDYHYVHTSYTVRDNLQTLKDALIDMHTNGAIPYKDVQKLQDRIDHIVDTLYYPLGYKRDNVIRWNDQMISIHNTDHPRDPLTLQDRWILCTEYLNRKSQLTVTDRLISTAHRWKHRDNLPVVDRYEMLHLQMNLPREIQSITDRLLIPEYRILPRSDIPFTMRLVSTNIHGMSLPAKPEILTLSESVRISTENKGCNDRLSMHDRLTLVSMIVERPT